MAGTKEEFGIMKKKKIRIAIIFGGKSAEHEVSIQSAKNVYNALDKDKYDPVLIGIDKQGDWHRLPEVDLLSASVRDSLTDKGERVAIIATEGAAGLTSDSTQNESETIDVVFPVLHGTYGEDGSMQGLLKLANVPFVGSGVLGSAIAMDKDVTKRLLQAAGLPVCKFLVFNKAEDISFEKVKKTLGIPCFVKPANLGSSVGIAKVKNKEELAAAVTDAFRYDTKILIEEFIQCREIECSVLGNDKPVASVPGEVIPKREFYDYEAKYTDNGMELQVPPQLSAKKIKEIQQLAIKAFKALCLEGMARVDFFLTKEEKVYISEANTIPGFTNMSVYPTLWGASGISYKDLIDKLIQLAIEKYEQQKQLKTTI